MDSNDILNSGLADKAARRRDLWQPRKGVVLDCDGCVFDFVEYEKEPSDGGAPCKRCSRWDGDES